MADIPAVTAARAFALQTDVQRLRDQQEQARARLEARRQGELDTRNLDASRQREAERQRLQRLRADIRTDNDQRAERAAQDQAVVERLADVRQQRTDTVARANDIRAFDQASVDRQLELDRNAFAAPPTPTPQTEDTGRVARPDAVAAPPPADNAPPPEATPNAEQSREAAFQAQVAERDARLAERRAAAEDAAIQQRIDLRLAGDRIDATLFNPELPRGSVVDVTA